MVRLDAGRASVNITVGNPTNDPPVVNITSPPNGSSFTPADSIPFAGTATDTKDGDISASIEWTSSIDGVIGMGAAFSTTLSAGGHIVTAAVTDSDGNSDSDTIRLSITSAAGNAPVVTIVMPAEGSTHPTATPVAFEGTASDAEDGDLTGNLQWTSSIDGLLGRGGSFSATLSDGAHTITASVTDSDGMTGSSDVNITVGGGPNTPPTVVIVSPANGSTHPSGSNILFQGTATDAEDGDISAGIQWSSHVDGAIGVGASFSAVLSDGVHQITASVTDSDGNSASAVIRIIVSGAQPRNG